MARPPQITRISMASNHILRPSPTEEKTHNIGQPVNLTVVSSTQPTRQAPKVHLFTHSSSIPGHPITTPGSGHQDRIFFLLSPISAVQPVSLPPPAARPTVRLSTMIMQVSAHPPGPDLRASVTLVAYSTARNVDPVLYLPPRSYGRLMALHLRPTKGTLSKS